jgi:hypothetical protein
MRCAFAMGGDVAPRSQFQSVTSVTPNCLATSFIDSPAFTRAALGINFLCFTFSPPFATLIIFSLAKNVKRFCKKHLKNKKPPPSGSGEVFESQVKNSARYEVFEVEVKTYPGSWDC